MDQNLQKQNLKDNLSKAGIIYDLGADGISICTTIGKDFSDPDVLKADNVCKEYYGKNVLRMNKGIRCEDTCLIAGNIPCFAMGTVNKDTEGHMPPILGLGEFHFKVLSKDREFLFDSGDRIDVTFVPNGTKWEISFEDLRGIKFHIYVSLLRDYGIGATVYIEGNVENLDIKLICWVEEPRIADHVPTYFSDNCVKIVPSFSNLCKYDTQTGSYYTVVSKGEEPQYGQQAAYGFYSQGEQQIKLDKYIYIEIPVETEGCLLAVSGVHSPLGETLDLSRLSKSTGEVEKVIKETEKYYNDLLSSAKVKTPDTVLNAGVSWAVLNLDYVHIRHAWVEGGQWWNVYFTNNYQLSAATALGQYEKVARALRFFADLENGYSVIALNKESLDRWTKKDGTKALGFDGLPYYLHQLWQYTRQTGDFSVVKEKAGRLQRLCKELLEVCDADKDNLLSWNQGANPFMYQGDHLFVPGKGTSPSVMMAGDFAKFAELLEHIGDKDQALEYRNISRNIYQAIPELWSQEQGVFYSCIDLKGECCNTHYYTDFVFPVLYGDELPVEQKILPLMALTDRLIYTSPCTGKLLMRVGELKPDIFGNNNVMPVQIAETARAFFLIGDYQAGYDLISSCGYAMSIFTENPGSSPEKLNSLGKGEPDYMFGNPCASTVYTAVCGMMGAEIKDWGETVVFQPGFPFSLPSWEFCLSYITASCCNNISEKGTIVYDIKLPAALSDRGAKVKRLEFGLFIPVTPGLDIEKDLEIFCNGQKVGYDIAPGVNAHKISISITVEERGEQDFSAELILRFAKALVLSSASLGKGYANKTIRVKQGESFTLPLAPFQEPVGSYRDEILMPGTFYRMYYDRHSKTYGVIRIIAEQDNINEIKYPALQASKVLQINIRDLCNSDHVYAVNAWRYGSAYKVRFLRQSLVDGRFLIPAEGVVYHGNPADEKGDNTRVCLLSYGKSNIVAGKITPASYPHSVTIKVNKEVSAASLLYVTETEARLSGPDQKLGRIILSYWDGSDESIPLVSCSNMGSILGNYAKDTCHIPLKEHGYDSANHLAIHCNDQKILKDITISIDKEDVLFGLVAVNVYYDP